ncbi:metal-sensitive transcriptional regulator [Bifidobacterium thermophilum]|uniref:Copper-sensing transcriptional repressor CsoR n=1 Tax=Bifidobacterium thermophilum RBL67 TaxID=1254439 RepID=M4RI60_9BIFI|nr:metal-sensitive transcriptional regulator [Bifidobacterium thermophilum]AGH41859.1 copper-sensing transcriptional repressor CsoR [Bifidobacterium thermophilum RBL67]MDW8486906.1 metal-sensitive transcriptional regulator [Bifidobacterium thermophilum]
MNGYAGDKENIQKRMHRIEGQVKAIGRMVDDDRYCIDILTQIAAVESALKSVSMLLLDDHLDHCVREAVEQGGQVADTKLQEVSEAVSRLVK